jgi:hypothetical protein
VQLGLNASDSDSASASASASLSVFSSAFAVARHSRESGNPVTLLSSLNAKSKKDEIPAFAGMTMLGDTP